MAPAATKLPKSVPAQQILHNKGEATAVANPCHNAKRWAGGNSPHNALKVYPHRVRNRMPCAKSA